MLKLLDGQWLMSSWIYQFTNDHSNQTFRSQAVLKWIIHSKVWGVLP